MGLDMYLYAKKSMAGYSFLPEQEQEQYRDIVNMVGADFADRGTPMAQVEICAMYWRKANAIHGWFVRNCQNGEDDCREYWVSRESLIMLRDLCVEVVQNHDKAEELLPTESGFFFGGTEYDEYYFDEVAGTASKITKLLNSAPDEWEFYYHSSW